MGDPGLATARAVRGSSDLGDGADGGRTDMGAALGGPGGGTMAKGRALTGEEPGERKRRRLLDAAAASVTTVDAEALAFQHSIFCQTGLPSYFEFTVDAVTGIIAYSAVCNMLVDRPSRSTVAVNRDHEIAACRTGTRGRGSGSGSGSTVELG
jgi:hypothetical protein